MEQDVSPTNALYNSVELCKPFRFPSFLNSPSWYQSISSTAYPLSDYQHTILHRLLTILSFSILSKWPNHQRTTSSIFSSTPFITPYNYFIYAFRTLYILFIPSKPLRLSICTAPILDLSFSFQNIV